MFRNFDEAQVFFAGGITKIPCGFEVAKRIKGHGCFDGAR
jgi:hypothetical protein